VEATFRHPFWVVRGEALADRPRLRHLPPVPAGSTTPGRWVDAGDVRVGDEVLLRDVRVLPVEAIRHTPFAREVYNFEVEGLHCYAVGPAGLLVHNANGDETEKPGGAGENNGPARQRFLFPEMEDPVPGTGERLPPFDGTTEGVLIPHEPAGDPVPMRSGPERGARFPFDLADGHCETNAARWMAEHGVTDATLYHNHPNGTCPNCDAYLPTYLQEGSTLRVVPPRNARARTRRWVTGPKSYTGNSGSPF
jgi:hypothetical protein